MLIETQIDTFNICAVDRPDTPLRVVIAIPVYNEAERIGACLDAIAVQDDVPATSLGIVLFLNNCTDGTADVVAAHRRAMPFPVRVVERLYDGATAGWARREAMAAAAAWLGSADGAILTTDADSRVPRDWVARNLAALDAGADAVAGRIALDADEAARLPDALHARGGLEGAYEALLTEIAARIDPEVHNPWPCHWTMSGATLAVRLSTYRRIGGMPAIPVGEDRAFVARLHAHDARVRHDPGIVVVTSGRLDGRAPGGAADTMKLRCEAPESPCDDRLEPLGRAVFRCSVRRAMRLLYASGRLGRTGLWARVLAIPRERAAAIAAMGTIGQVLAAVERESPRLAFRPLRPRELAPQIARAQALLRLLRAADRATTRLRTGLERAKASRPAAGGLAPVPEPATEAGRVA